MEHLDQPAGAASIRAGDRLRAAREEQGLTLDEISIRTRVPKRLLDAIETGDYAALPAPTYSAGFVKAYAQMLGMDQTELSQQFRIDLGGNATPRHRPEPFAPADPARVPAKFLAIVALIVAILIAAGYGIWRGGSLSGEGTDDRARLAAGTVALPPVGSAPTVVPEALPAAAPIVAAAPATDGPVVLTATDAAWLRVYERGGKTLYIGEMPAGQTFTVPADAVDPLIRTSRPEALRIAVGGRDIPTLGPASKLLRDVSLSRQSLLARSANAPAAAGPTPPAASDGTSVAPLAPLVPQGANP